MIAGWTEAMQMMKEGDHWELFIPSGETTILLIYLVVHMIS